MVKNIMFIKKKNKLEHSIEFLYPRVTVKELFKDFEEEYKRLRNLTNQDIEEYKEALLLYTKYMNKREENGIL